MIVLGILFLCIGLVFGIAIGCELNRKEKKRGFDPIKHGRNDQWAHENWPEVFPR